MSYEVKNSGKAEMAASEMAQPAHPPPYHAASPAPPGHVSPASNAGPHNAPQDRFYSPDTMAQQPHDDAAPQHFQHPQHEQHEQHSQYPQQPQQTHYPPQGHYAPHPQQAQQVHQPENEKHGSVQQQPPRQFQNVTALPNLQSGPAPVQCPACGARALTHAQPVVGNTTHAWAAGICCLIGLGCIPYCVTGTKDVEQKCGNCGALLAVWHRSGRTEVMMHT